MDAPNATNNYSPRIAAATSSVYLESACGSQVVSRPALALDLAVEVMGPAGSHAPTIDAVV